MNSVPADLVAYLPMSLVVMDENMDIITASREAFAMFGVRFKADIEKTAIDELSTSLFGRRELTALIGACTLRMRNVGSSETFKWQDENRFYDITVFTLPPQDSPNYGVRFINTTHQLEIERDRDTARNYLEVILDSVTLGLTVMDCDMRITAANTAQLGVMRLIEPDITIMQVVGSQADVLFADETDTPWSNIRDTVLGSGEVMQGMIREYRVSDETRTFAISIAPLRNPDKEIIGAIRVAEDITERIALEQEAREAEQLAARWDMLDQLSVTLNHEINTSLTSIMSNVELSLNFGDEIPESKRGMLEEVLSAAERMRGFVEKLTNLKEIKTVDYLEGGQEKMLDI